MKTRSWALLLGAVFLILAGLVLWQRLGSKPGGAATVYADGVPVQTIDLSVDGEYRVESAAGWNLLTVQDGKLAVTAASAPRLCQSASPARIRKTAPSSRAQLRVLMAGSPHSCPPGPAPPGRG